MDFQVMEPEAGDIWKCWLDGFTVEWEPTGSDSVVIELVHGSETVGSLSGWIENDGHFHWPNHLPWTSQSGSGYRIRITDDQGEYGESGEIHLDNDLDVDVPADGQTWYRHGGPYSVEWTPSSSTLAWMKLYRNDMLVADFPAIAQEGHYQITESLLDSLRTGTGYRFRVQELCAFSGWSGTFSIVEAAQGPVGIQFAPLNPGSFEMGAYWWETGSTDNERPVHDVSIQYAFQISVTEITQDQWTSIMGWNPSRFLSPDGPVENVSWNDCRDFVDSLNFMDSDWTYRLPSEAEWEYACRAGTSTRFYWGNEVDEDYCWYAGNSGGSTHGVGTREPNRWNLMDLSGNVLEWCEDEWHPDYQGAPDDGSVWGEGESNDRVIRGGCWNYGEDFCRSAFRFSFDRSWASDYIGFRIVREVR